MKKVSLFEIFGKAFSPKSEVIIQQNQYVNAKVSEDFSKHVKSVIVDIIGEEPEWHLWASSNVYQLLKDLASKRQLKDAALLIFGNDWQYAVESLKGLTIQVEGYCPECGEKLCDAFYETVAQSYEAERDGISYSRCFHCNFSDLEL